MAVNLTSIFRFLFRRPQVETELDAELRYHIDRETEQNIARGMPREEARRQAAILVGGVAPLKDDCRDARLGRGIEVLWQDIRYGLRVLRKNPGFAIAGIGTLALGIGANTAIFSVVYGVLLRPLPYRNGDQLLVLHQNAPKAHSMDFPFSVKEIADYRNGNHTLQSVVEHHTMNFLLIGRDTGERVDTAVVSANFFDVLGIQPLLGRTFVAADDVPGGPAVLILTYKYWKTHQSGDPNIVGKVFQMNNRPHTVIGVLPPIPQYPSEVDVYMPTSQCPYRSSPAFIANRDLRMMTVFCRRKPDVTIAQVQADLDVVASHMVAANPKSYHPEDGYTLQATPLETDLTSRARTMFLVLLGVAGFVLLIACANVANLLLARLVKLDREFAVRIALGAGKARLVRQLLTESVLLSLGGGLLGLLLAPASLGVLVKFAERFTTRAAEVRIDTAVLLFTLIVAVGTGLLFGLAPVLTSHGGIGDSFQQAGRTTVSRRWRRLRGALVIAQVAVSVILLAGAGLMIRSFAKLQSQRPGFSPDRILTLRITPGFPPYQVQTIRTRLGEPLIAKIRATPGIESAAMSSTFPFNPVGLVSGPNSNGFDIQDRPLAAGQPKPTTDIRVVGTNYFETIRQPIVKGRTFTEQDITEKAPPAAIINQAMARHYWPNEDPIGKRLSFDNRASWTEIVGIAGDAKDYGLDHAPVDEIYLAYRNGWVPRLVVRTGMDADNAAPLLRAAIREIDSHLAIDQIMTIERAEYDSMASPRVMTFLLGIFAGLAVLISSSGIAAMMALSVSQRTREIGIRVALGAQRSAIVNMVVSNGLMLALAGAALGMAGAAALTKLLSSFLFGISPTDALTFAGVSAFFLLVVAAACYIPARQVTAIDPLNALRQE